MADPIPEGWTEEPVAEPLPAGWTEEPVKAEPLPDGWTEEPLEKMGAAHRSDSDHTRAPEQPGPVAPEASPIDGFTTEEIDREVKRDARRTLLRTAWDAAQGVSPDDATATAALSKQLGVPFDLVRANLPKFRAAAKSKDFGKWEQDNQEIADTILANPHLGEAIITSPDIPMFVKAWRAARRWREDLIQRSLDTPEKIAKERERQMGFEIVPSDPVEMTLEERAAGKDVGGLTPEQVKAREAARAKEDVPKSEVQILTPEAAALRAVAEKDPSAVARFGAHALGAMLRVEEAYNALQKSHLVTRLAAADVGLSDEHPEDLQAEISDADLKSRPLALGDEHGIWRDVAVAGQALASSAEIGKTVLEAGGAGYAAGAAIGGGATLAITKNPAAAMEAAQGFGSLVGGKTAGAAAFLASSELEGSEMYESMRGSKTEDGTPVPNEVAFIASYLVVGPLAGSLESLSFGKMAAPFKHGLPEFVTGLVKRDPNFRALLARMFKQYAESVATETVTEFLQDGVHQVIDYVTKSGVAQRWQEKGYDVEQGLEAGYGGFAGAIVMGGAGGVHELATFKQADARAEVDDKQVGPLLDAADIEAVKADPDAWAETVLRESTKEGKPITGGHVDAVKTLRLLQEEGKTGPEAVATIRDLAGAQAADDFLTAAITPGAKFEVPMAKMLSTWGASELGKKLRDDTTLDASSPTVNQRKEQGEAIKTEAKRIADEEVAKAEEAAVLLDRQNEVVKQLTDRGVKKGLSRRDAAEQARAGAKLITAFARTAGVDFAQAASSVFPETPFSFHAGDEQSTGHASDHLLEGASKLSPEERAQGLFIDPITGLRNEEAFNATPLPAGHDVGVMTLVDTKAINDAESGGHDTANKAFTQMGGLVGGIHPDAARGGTNFFLPVKGQQGLEEAMAKVRAGLPAGVAIEGALGADSKQALTRLDESTLSKRAQGLSAEIASPVKLAAIEAAAAGDVFQGSKAFTADEQKALQDAGLMLSTGNMTKGQVAAFKAEVTAREKLSPEELQARQNGALLPRGKTRVAATDITDASFTGAGAKPNLSAAHIKAAEKATPGEYVAKALRDPKVSELLTRAGFGLEQHPFVAAYDLKGLKLLNDTHGKAVGDRVIEEFGRAMVRAGGQGQRAAHLSGDEYAAGGRTRAELDRFNFRLDAELARVEIPVTFNGEQLLVRPFFRTGIAEKTYGNADKALNAAKRAEAARGDAGRVGADVRREPGSQNLRGSDSAQAPGGEGPGGADRAAAAGDEQVPEWVTEDVDQHAAETIAAREANGPLRSEEAEAIRQGFNLPEAVLAARVAVKGFTTKAKEGKKGESQQAAVERALEAKRRLDERVGAATAFLDWVENTGPGLGETGVVGQREGVFEASKEVKRSTELWLRNEFNIVDPESGISDLTNSAREGIPDDMRRAKTFAVKSTYARELKRDRQEAFATNVQGRSRYNQADQQSRAAVSSALEDELPPKVEDRPALRDAVANELKKAREAADDAFRAWRQHEMGVGPEWMAPAAERAKDHALRAVSHEIEAREIVRTGKLKASERSGDQIEKAPGWDPLLRDLTERQKGPSKSSVLFQDDATGGDQPHTPKGYVELPATRRALETIKVFLNKSYDASTIFHETAHGFLEHLADLAERPDAPQRTKDTYAAALKWLGVETRGQITRDHHERWARTFEAYLYEGKAPSAQLAAAFQRFKLWLTNIYRSLQGIPQQDLNDDVRKVFDALLATEDELEAFKKKQGVENTAKPEGVSDEEWATKLEEQREEMEELTRKAQMLALKDRLRVTEKWWKAGIARAEEEAAAEYEQLPARQAQLILQGEHPVHSLNNEPVVLDRAAVEKVFGKKRREGVRTEKDGVSPDLVAELAGFPTGEAMLKALLELRPRDAWVKETAEQRMEEAHPSVLTDRTELRKLVQDALAGYTEKRLLAEQWVKGPEMESLRQAAALIVEKRELGKLNPHVALARQRAASKAKAVASAKGEWAAVHEAARAEALNAHIYSELMRAKEQREKLEVRMARMGKKDFLNKLGKAAPAYRDAIGYLLQALGAKEPDAALTDATLPAVVAQMNGDAAAIGDPEWLEPVRGALARTNELAKLTVTESRSFAAALKHIEQAARDRTEVTDGEKRASKEEVVARFLVAISAVLPKRKGVAEAHVRTIREKLRVGLNGADGQLLSPVDMVRDLTGDDQNSVLTQYIVNPVRRAAIRKADLTMATLKPVVDATNALPKSVRKRWGTKVDGKAVFPTHVSNQGVVAPRYFHEKIGMALNAGSESSLQVLTNGRGITEAEVRKFLSDLSAEDIAYVNTVHAAVGSLREEAFALEERMTGARPRAVEARPMVLPNGTLTGGYYPLKAIKDGSQVGARVAGGEMAQLFDPTYTSPSTPHGWTNERTGATYPVSLDLAVGLKHVQAVVHDITHREVVKSVASLVLDKKVATALQDHLGAPKAAEFLKWLKDLGGATAAEHNTLDRVGDWVRSNFATSLLSGLGTAASNWANLPTAVASTKLKAKHLAAAVAQLGGDAAFGFLPATGLRKLAIEKSGILRAMDQDAIAGLKGELRDPAAGQMKRGLEWVREAGMAVMKGVDNTVSTAVWLGSYRQGLAENMEEDAAVRFADDVLLQVQPTSMASERAGILRSKTGLGAVVMFYGYLSVAYRAQHRIAAPLFTQDFQNANPAEKAWKAAKVAGQMAAFYIAYQVLGELLAGRGPEDGDDDKDEKSKSARWSRWFARKMVTAPFATLPVAGSILSAGIDSAFTGKPLMAQQRDPVSSALLQGVTTLLATSAAANDPTEAKKEKALRELLRTIGTVTGLPTRLLDTSVRYMLETTLGSRTVPSAGAAASGFVYGERENQPDNIPKALGDGLDPMNVSN